MQNANRAPIVSTVVRRFGGFAAVFVALATGCLDPSPDHQHGPGDSGPMDPVDPAVVAALESRFLAVADGYADERCRCAGDLAICRRDLRADWDDGGRACIDEAIARDAPGFDAAIDCLEIAEDTFVTCHAMYVCNDVDPRVACADAFESEGTRCIGMMSSSASSRLAACSPTTPDAGP